MVEIIQELNKIPDDKFGSYVMSAIIIILSIGLALSWVVKSFREED